MSLSLVLIADLRQPHLFDALHPVLDVFEGLLVCDVVHQDDALMQSGVGVGLGGVENKETGHKDSVKGSD